MDLSIAQLLEIYIPVGLARDRMLVAVALYNLDMVAPAHLRL